jgi:hypothetical protein
MGLRDSVRKLFHRKKKVRKLSGRESERMEEEEEAEIEELVALDII